MYIPFTDWFIAGHIILRLLMYNNLRACFMVIIENTKNQHQNCTLTPTHVVISIGELEDCFDTQAAKMR